MIKSSGADPMWSRRSVIIPGLFCHPPPALPPLLAWCAETHVHGRARRFGFSQRTSVPGNTQTAREPFCHAQNHFKFPVWHQCKNIKVNIKVISACEEGDQVPLHHGEDTSQCAPTPTKAMSRARADLLSLNTIQTIIK